MVGKFWDKIRNSREENFTVEHLRTPHVDLKVRQNLSALFGKNMMRNDRYYSNL